jgi:hypothetical protein
MYINLPKHSHNDCSVERRVETVVQKCVDAVGLGTQTG